VNASYPQLRWKMRMPASGSMMLDQLLYAWDDDARLIGIDLTTGAIRERRDAVDVIDPEIFAADGQTLFLITGRPYSQSRSLCAYDLTRASIVWSTPMRHDWISPVARHDLVCSLCDDGVLHAFDARTGHSRWTLSLKPNSASFCHLVLANDTLFVVREGAIGFEAKGALTAVDAATGDVKWSYATAGHVQEALAVSPELVVLGTRSPPWALEALEIAPRRAVGKVRWRCPLAGWPRVGTIADELVIWRCDNGYVQALSLGNGEPMWRFQAGASGGRPCVHDGWVFLGAEGYLYGLDAASGALRWKYFVVDGDAEDARSEAARKPKTAVQESEGDEQWKREWDAYHGEERNTPEGPTPVWPPAVTTWSRGQLLYVLTSQRFLYAFEPPGYSARRAAPP
jgi:outer membrane protein assembly factor BamB